MNFFKYSAIAILGFLVMAGSAHGQMKNQQSAQPDSITDKELKKFAKVTSEVQKIQQESRKQVQAMLADKEMDMQRFQQIMMSKRNPKMADSINVTKKEQKTIKEIQPKLQKMQQQSRKEMMGVMQENGLKPQRFQAIMRAVRSDPAVMKRFQKIAQQEQDNGNKRQR